MYVQVTELISIYLILLNLDSSFHSILRIVVCHSPTTFQWKLRADFSTTRRVCFSGFLLTDGSGGGGGVMVVYEIFSPLISDCTAAKGIE